MPVYKFKSHEDAEAALWTFSPDAAYYKRVAALWRFANRLNPISYPAGLYKFRSLEEANRHREEIELAQARALRARRRAEENKQPD